MKPKWTRTSSVLSRLMRVNAPALSDWSVSDPPSEMHLRFCSRQEDSAVCCTPPRHAWDSTTVPVVVSVPLMFLQPVWFSRKVRHDVCGGRHRWARRNVIEDYKRGTASKYSICHTFVWEQKGWRTVSSYYEPIVFSYPCPPSSCYPISIACAEWFSHVYTIITLHFQPSQSYKYLVYRLLMFIQSTGLHCLGKIARQGPFGKEKENHSKWKVMIHTTDNVWTQI